MSVKRLDPKHFYSKGDGIAVLDGRAKDLPTDQYSYKLSAGNQFGLDIALPDAPDIDESKMSMWIPFADGNRRDGVGDLLEVEGIRLERHRKNPIVLFDHGKEVKLPIAMAAERDANGKFDFNKYTVQIDPIAKCARLNAFFYQGKGLADVDRRQEYDHAVLCEQYFDMACKRMLGAGSIGYQVLRAIQLQPDYERGTPPGLHLLSVLMLEGSLVVLPANMDTIKGLMTGGKCCGKKLSPVLVKSLAACVGCGTKAEGGWSFHGVECDKQTFDKWKESVANDRCPWCDAVLSRRHNNLNSHLRSCPAKPTSSTKAQIAGDLDWMKEEESEAEHKPRPRVASTGVKGRWYVYDDRGKYHGPVEGTTQKEAENNALQSYPALRPEQLDVNPFPPDDDEKVLRRKALREKYRKDVVPVPLNSDLTRTKIPPSRWKPGVGAIKKKKGLTRQQHDSFILSHYGPALGRFILDEARNMSPSDYENYENTEELKQDIDENLDWEKWEYSVGGDYTRRYGGKSLPAIRRKYQPLRGIRKKLRKSIAGTSIVSVGKDGMAKAMELAKSLGLKAEFVSSSKSGASVKMKLSGDDAAIDKVAKEYGTRFKGISNRDRDKVRKLQDQFLNLGIVRQFIQNNGENKPIWEGGPSASQLRAMIYPNWTYKLEEIMNEHKGLKTMPQEVTREVHEPEIEAKAVKICPECGAKIEPDTKGGHCVKCSYSAKHVSKGTKDMDTEAEITPEEDMADEKYSAQLLRQMHDDAMLLLEEYDKARGPLEHEEIDAHLVGKLESLVEEIETIEALFEEHHPDAEPLKGMGKETEKEHEVEEENEENVEAEEEESGGTQQASSGEPEKEEETPPEEVAEAMRKPEHKSQIAGDLNWMKEEEEESEHGAKTKSLRAKYHKGRKAQPSAGISPEKARQILKDDEVRGHKLTEKQRGMFGAAAGRGKGITDSSGHEHDESGRFTGSGGGKRKDEKKERMAYDYARSSQGFDGTWNDWLNLPKWERDEYEEGAAGKPTSEKKFKDVEPPGYEEHQDKPGTQTGERDLTKALEPHERQNVAEARDYASELSTSPDYGDEHRMKSYHFHKALGGIAGTAIGTAVGGPVGGMVGGAIGGAVDELTDENKKAADPHNVPGYEEHQGKPGTQGPGVAGAEGVGYEEHQEKPGHPHRVTAGKASEWFKSMAFTRDFGDRHRMEAGEVAKALDFISKEDESVEVQHPDATPGEMGEKDLALIIEQQNKAIQEITADWNEIIQAVNPYASL